MRSFDVYWEASPLFFLSKFVGIAPYNESFRLSKFHTPFTLLMLSLILLDAFYVGVYMEKVNDSFQLSGFSLILERAQLIMVILTVVVCMTKAIKNVKLIRSVMESLAAVDDHLAMILSGHKRQRFAMYCTLFARFLFLFSLVVVDCVVSKMHRKLGSMMVEYILMYPLIVINTVESQFIVLLNIVKRRIVVVTSKLNELIRKGRRSIDMEVLQVLATVHSTLVDLCEDINSLYSHQILMIFSGIFILITSNLYHVTEKLIHFIKTGNVSQLSFATITTYRVFVRAYEVWTVVTSCSKVNNKAKEFNSQVFQLMIDDQTEKLSNDKKLRLHIAMKRDVVFTACGFFNLDYTLIHSMIAAATTYLVILIQFGQPNSSPSPTENSQVINTTTPMAITEFSPPNVTSLNVV